MNNRYICKAKRKDNNEWVTGYYVCLNENCHLIYTGYAVIDCGYYYPEYYEVIPETVRQYTGLKDKNGKWIFEGDVLGTDTVSGFVLYENGCFAFRWKNNDKYRADFYKNCILTNYARINELEVIGNIHDNPELFEVER